jgi:hypothetical protein
MKYPHLYLAAVEIGQSMGVFTGGTVQPHEHISAALATLEESVGASKMAAAESELSQLSIEALFDSCAGRGGESSLAVGGAADTALTQLEEEL